MTKKAQTETQTPPAEVDGVNEGMGALSEMLVKPADTIGHKWSTSNEVHLAVFTALVKLLGYDGKLTLQKQDNTLYRFLIERILHHALNGGTITITSAGIEFDDAPISPKEWMQMSDADWKEFLKDAGVL